MMMDDDKPENEDAADTVQDESPGEDDTATDTAGAGGSPAEDDHPQGVDFDEIEGIDPNAEEEQDFKIGEAMAGDVTAIYDIPVQISAVLGRSSMQVSQLLKLGRGAVVELDRKVGEAIDIYVNNRLVARGEVVVVEDKLGVTMTEIVKSDRS